MYGLLNRIPARKLIPHACQKVITLILKIAGINQFHKKYVGIAATMLTIAIINMANTPKTIAKNNFSNVFFFLILIV